MSTTYKITGRTDLDDVTIVTITEWPAARRWTLISTASGEDVIVTPSGQHLDVDPAVESTLSAAVRGVLDWVAATV